MRKFGLIGKALSHSFSRSFFEEKFQREHIDATFENIELSDIQLVDSIIKNVEFSGLSVTNPYKEAIIPFLDELSDEAKAIGAVNCISFKNGKSIGHNTDAFGFQQMIKPFLTNQHERALILGTGGAAKAVAHVLNQIGLEVFWISRTPSGSRRFNYKDINEFMLGACKLVVHCTPVGTYPFVEKSVRFPFNGLTTDHLCVDLIYNPEVTKFLQESKNNGATILNGLSMLKEQANKAWEIWNK